MSHSFTLREVAHALGGEIVRGAVLAPGPGHTRRDRSLSVKLSPDSPDGFLCFSHAGDDFRDCKDYVRSKLGLPQDGWRDNQGLQGAARFQPPASSSADDEARIERAVAIWNEGRDPRGTLVEQYLASRGLHLDDIVSVAALRFYPACPWRDEARQQTIRVPAMVAAMRQADGDRLTAVHRTRLTEDGRKVDRRMLGIAAGACIKLDPDEVVTHGLTIGEGIETVLSGRLLGFRPAWATGAAGGIAKFPVLSGIKALTILTERDDTGTNERVTNECGERWHATGREVILVEPTTGNDVNDALRGAA